MAARAAVIGRRCVAGPSSLRAARRQSTLATPHSRPDEVAFTSPSDEIHTESSTPPSSSPSTPPSTVGLDQVARRKWRNTLDYLSTIGSTQTRESVWKPAYTRLKPPSPREVTISHLMAATAHVGHIRSKIVPAFQPYVYGTRHGIAQIDVEKATLPSLRRACKVVREVVLRDGVVLIVGTQKETSRAVIAATKRMGANGYHVTVDKWSPGILSNAPILLSRAIMASLSEYQEMHEEMHYNQNREGRHGWEEDDDYRPPSVPKLASQLLRPDLLIVLNPKINFHAIHEATLNSIPSIGIIDTDVDPRLVTYPIPANDESVRVQELIVGVLSKAGEEGKLERQRLLAMDERASKKNDSRRRSEERLH